MKRSGFRLLVPAGFCLIFSLFSCSSDLSGSCYRVRDNEVYLHYYGGYPRGEHVYLKVVSADPDSFKFYKGSREGDCQSGVIFARDGRHVYYRNFIIDSADPASFKPLGNGYSADSNGVFFKKDPVPDADAESFFIVKNSSMRPWGADKNWIFYKGSRLVSHVDGATLEILHPPFFKDAGNVYYGMDFKILKGALPESFISPPYGKIIQKSFYLYDEKRGYYYEKINSGSERISVIDNIESTSFKQLSSVYASDMNNVYYRGNVIAGADSDSFSVPVKSRPGRGRDRYRLYEDGKAVQGY